MNNDNPLRIFTKDQLDTIDPNNLKQLKKEILLEFQLTSKATIVLNEVEIDKNGVLEIFSELESNLDTYLFVHQHQQLNAFLNKGDFTFLKDDEAIQSIKKLSVGKDVVEQKIVSQLQNLIPEYINAPNPKTHSKLKTIKRFVNQLNPLLIDEIYSKTYDDIKNHIEYLEANFETPFSGVKYDKYNPELRKHVNLNYYESFEFLPASFKVLAHQYCSWCNNSIVYESLRIQKELNKYSRESLYILKNAARIASKEINTKENLQIANSIQRYLDKGGGSQQSRSSSWIILIVIIFVIRLVFAFDKCSDSSPNRYTYNTKNVPKQVTVFEKKVMEEAQKKLKKQKQDLIDNPIRITKFNILEYGGEKKIAVNANLIKEREKENYSELTYNVSVLPSKNSFFKFLIPPELADMHKGKIWPVVMNFKHPQIKNSTLQHKVFFDFKTNKKVYPQKYIHKKDESDQGLFLSLNKISQENYPLNGVLSRVDSKNGDVLYSTKFRITYKPESETYIVTLKPSNKKLTFTQDYLSKMDPSYAIEDVDKFAIAIKNLNLIDNKYLQQGKMYSMENVFGYTFEELNNTKFQSRKFVSEKASLKYYITSEKDNTAYIELKGQYVSIKYFADYASGEVKGFTMVNSSDNTYGMETMTIFGSK